MVERDPKRAAEPKAYRVRGGEPASVAGGATFAMDEMFGQHVAGGGSAVNRDEDHDPRGEVSESELWDIVKTFDARLSEAERRIDGVLARLGIA